jgi:hypothetical protein
MRVSPSGERLCKEDGVTNRIGIAGVAAGVIGIGVALAEPFVDYTPMPGAWEIQTRTIEPTHIDDYLKLLHSYWVPMEEIEKKHGIIDDYKVLVKINSAEGGNVLLLEHYPTLSSMEPDRARDQAVQRESDAFMSRDRSDKLLAGIDSYRSFASDVLYRSVDVAK